MNTVVFGDSLAKGIVHQMARDYTEHLIRHGEKLRAMRPLHSECRKTRYKHAIKAITGFFGSGLTRAFESGEGKQRVWSAFAVMRNESGGFVRSFYRVPFKTPTDFEVEDLSISAAPHCVQRLIQIHGISDPHLVTSLWMVHSAALDRAIVMGPPSDKACYITFGVSEMLIWRPSEREEGGWVSVTAIGTDALDGPNLKLQRRLYAGIQDTGVVALVEADYAVYLSKSLRLRLAMGLLDIERKAQFPQAA